MKNRTKIQLLTVGPIIMLMSISIAYAQPRKPWVAPAPSQAVKNPVAPDAASLKAAKTLYISNCAPCHGEKGKGDGPAAAALNPKPADHTNPVLNTESDGSLFWKISEGRLPMPQYKTTFTDVQRWQLVNYIRTLSKTGKK